MKLFNKESGICVDKCGKKILFLIFKKFLSVDTFFKLLYYLYYYYFVCVGCLDPEGIPREVKSNKTKQKKTKNHVNFKSNLH